jgi:hypothetical protein
MKNYVNKFLWYFWLFEEAALDGVSSYILLEEERWICAYFIRGDYLILSRILNVAQEKLVNKA